MKFRNKYQLIIITEDSNIEKEYVKLKWAYKSWNKFCNYQNVISAKVIAKSPGMYDVTILYFIKKQ